MVDMYGLEETNCEKKKLFKTFKKHQTARTCDPKINSLLTF